jgi:hypothetical protein
MMMGDIYCLVRAGKRLCAYRIEADGSKTPLCMEHLPGEEAHDFGNQGNAEGEVRRPFTSLDAPE